MTEPAALFFLIATPLFYALNGVLLKRASQSIPPFAAMAISMGILFVLSCICSMSLEKSFSWNVRENSGSFIAIVAVGFVNTVAFFCLLSAYQYVAVWQYQMFSLLTPIFAAFFAFWILGEPLSWKLFAGLLFVGVGLFIALR